MSPVPYGGACVQNMPEGLYGDFKQAEDMESVSYASISRNLIVFAALHLLTVRNSDRMIRVAAFLKIASS